MLSQLDHSLFHLLNSGLQNSVLTWFMPRVTNVHKTIWFILCVLPIIVWILWKKGKRGRTLVLCALLSLGLADFTSSRVGKNLWWRDRPCRKMPSTGRSSVVDVHLLPGRAMSPGYVATPEKDCPGSSSFPSSHAANSMAFASVCWWFTKRKSRWLWFLIPIIIGWSRIYLGYHYPFDVLAGWLLGAFLAWLIIHFLAARVLAEQIKEEQVRPPDPPVEPA
jgi:membrane-associated phospholipid phosphatase